MPGQSARRATAGRDSRSSTAPATSATAISGTLTQNTELHANERSSAPPAIGPSGSPTATATVSRLIAFGRSAGGNAAGTYAIASGMIAAAPTPMAARAAIEFADRARERAGGRGCAEQRHAGQQRAAATEPVADDAGRQHGAREGEHVCVDDPLQIGRARLAATWRWWGAPR